MLRRWRRLHGARWQCARSLVAAPFAALLEAGTLCQHGAQDGKLFGVLGFDASSSPGVFRQRPADNKDCGEEASKKHQERSRRPRFSVQRDGPIHDLQ